LAALAADSVRARRCHHFDMSVGDARVVMIEHYPPAPSAHAREQSGACESATSDIPEPPATSGDSGLGNTAHRVPASRRHIPGSARAGLSTLIAVALLAIPVSRWASMMQLEIGGIPMALSVEGYWIAIALVALVCGPFVSDHG
jgi:hypothetical protein